MVSELRDAQIHRLIAGALCLDFANTLNGRQHPDLHEYLNDYRDLTLWSRHAGILSQDQAKELLVMAERNPKRSLQVFEQAIELRERVFRIFSSLVIGGSPKPADLEGLHLTWLESLTHSHFVPVSAGYSLDWMDGYALDSPLWPIVDSAVKLLTSPDLERVRQCDGDGCDWLFVDASRNNQRRWCSMEQCGNRAKMRRRYARTKGS